MTLLATAKHKAMILFRQSVELDIASTSASSTSSDADLSLSDSTSIQDPKDLDESPKDSEPLATIVPNKKKKSQEIDPIDKYLINAIDEKR